MIDYLTHPKFLNYDPSVSAVQSRRRGRDGHEDIPRLGGAERRLSANAGDMRCERDYGGYGVDRAAAFHPANGGLRRQGVRKR